MRGSTTIAGIPSLCVLSLNGTDVSDAGLLHLMNIRMVHTLYLVDTNVTAAGLMQFKDRSSPLFVHVRENQVPADRVDELKRALPFLRFVH